MFTWLHRSNLSQQQQKDGCRPQRPRNARTHGRHLHLRALASTSSSQLTCPCPSDRPTQGCLSVCPHPQLPALGAQIQLRQVPNFKGKSPGPSGVVAGNRPLSASCSACTPLRPPDSTSYPGCCQPHRRHLPANSY